MFILKASKILYTECLKKIWLNKWNFIVSLLCRTALYIGQPKWVVWIFCPNTKVETGYPDASFKSKSLASHFLSGTFIFFLGCLNFVVHSLQKGKICRKNFFLIFFFSLVVIFSVFHENGFPVGFGWKLAALPMKIDFLELFRTLYMKYEKVSSSFIYQS